jgi:hypothetical protein
MSLPVFPQFVRLARPRGPRGKLRFTTAAPRRREAAPSAPQPKAPPVNDIGRFPRIHTPSLQLKRHLFPVRNE